MEIDTFGVEDTMLIQWERMRKRLQSTLGSNCKQTTDIMEDQIGLKEFVDPFTGDKNPQA